MAEINEPRALTSALSGPAFATRGVGLAMHVADRHVERWAPEAGANRMRPMRSLGFVDRMIAPWIETAQRSASMRLFSQYAGTGFSERAGGDVSWVFPRPWYQDELDWMAAARKAGPTASGGAQTPSMFTTRGTYVAPVQQQQPRPAPAALPTALYEYVAPSLSVAQPAAPSGVGHGGDTRDAYSPLVSLAAVQAAEVMSRVVAPTMSAPGRMSPALRSVLSTMLERAAAPRAIEPMQTRLAMQAPELVTPPAPRPDARPEVSDAPSSATQVAIQYAEQRARIAEVQRIARAAAERELVARSEAQRAEAEAARAPAPAGAEVRVAAQRAEAELRQRLAAAKTEEQRKQIEAEQAAATARSVAERARIEQRISQRLAERGVAQRLHDQARADAAAHVRTPIEQPVQTSSITSAEHRAPAEVTAALAALPPGLASFIGGRPERAMQRIDELNEAFRAVELMARGAAQGATFQVTRGPRLTMPVGLGGLVSAIDRAPSVTSDRPSGQRVPSIEGFAAAYAAHAQPTAAAAAPTSTLAAMRSPMRVPSLPFLTSPSFAPRTYAPTAPMAQTQAARTPTMRSLAPTTALGATAAATPNALSHVAWADRWLARFAGASQHSLDTLTAGGGSMSRMQALADAAPGAVFVSPMFDARTDGEQVRVDTAGRVIVTPGAKPSIASLVTPQPAPALSASQLAELSALVATLPAGAGSPASTMSPEAIARAVASGAMPATPGAPETIGPESMSPEAFERLSASTPVREAVRIADDAETPDDVFAEIAAAATRARSPRGRAPAAMPSPTAAMPAGFERATLADTIAHASPSSPGAGFAAQLASSPFAPALRHVLPMPSSMPFDVRALFGGGLSASYLAGLLAPASSELEIGAHAVPAWASWSFDDRAVASPLAERFAPEWDATYVSPDSPDAPPVELSADEARGELERIAGQPMTEQQAAQLAGAQLTTSAPLTTLRSGLLSFGLPYDIETNATVSAAAMHPAGISAAELAREFATPAFLYPNAVHAPSPSVLASETAASAAMSPMAARAMLEAMSLPMLGDAARDEDPATSWTAPGMIAERAHSYSVAQERTSSDLALDFVSPELVLAARVYGLGPVEAAQAARLALAGPGHLTAMAGTVDRTFVQAMAIEAERRERMVSPRTAYPTAAGETAIVGDYARRAPSLAWVAPDAAHDVEAVSTRDAVARDAQGRILRDASGRDIPARDALGREELAALEAAGFVAPSSGSSFGVDRRPPRGAFLWPSATISALGLNAAAPDGQQSMSVAALELLAAQAVAELGTYAALSEHPAESEGEAVEGAASSLATRGAASIGGTIAATDDAFVGGEARDEARGEAVRARAARELVGGTAGAAGIGAQLGAEPSEADVLGTAAALVPSARRARFEALYVALSQSPSGSTWSPAARAARALALAGRGEEGNLSARERAMTAWDVLPVVYAAAAGTDVSLADLTGTDHDADASPIAARAAGMTYIAGQASARTATAAASRRAGISPGAGELVGTEALDVEEPTFIERPGLGGLSSRAGEALGSYVTPQAYVDTSSSSSSSSSPAPAPRDPYQVGAVLRAPTAAPELVQTGRPIARYGGGEQEIPAWFETAARKLFEQQGNISAAADGISLSELTLISSTPSSQIAASTRGVPTSSTSLSPATGTTKQGDAKTPQIDVEKLANEIYRHILVMMDAARARNGEPYL